MLVNTILYVLVLSFAVRFSVTYFVTSVTLTGMICNAENFYGFMPSKQ